MMIKKFKISTQGRSAPGGKNSPGFTLIETLLSIFVLTLAFTGPISLASYTIRSASVSQNQFTAFFLAQEAIEYIKNRRDNNTLTGSGDWLEGLTGLGGNGAPCGQSNGCTVDISNNTVTACSSSCPLLRYGATTGLYSYNVGDAATIFTRKIRLARVNNYEEKIEVSISWQERFGAKSFTLEENILDWQ